MADTTTITPPYLEVFAIGEEHPAGEGCGFVCNICDRPVDDDVCPDHGPRDVPGLRLLPCEATPPHRVWVAAREDYGVPCLQCLLDQQWEQERQARQCRHWPWRRWKVTHRVASWTYQMGVTAGGSSWKTGDGCDGCLASLPRWKGRRLYVLGVPVTTWRCWRRGHRRGEEVGLGYCGKCMPWPCCGAQTVDHHAGCAEDV